MRLLFGPLTRVWGNTHFVWKPVWFDTLWALCYNISGNKEDNRVPCPKEVRPHRSQRSDGTRQWLRNMKSATRRSVRCAYPSPPGIVVRQDQAKYRIWWHRGRHNTKTQALSFYSQFRLMKPRTIAKTVRAQASLASKVQRQSEPRSVVLLVVNSKCLVLVQIVTLVHRKIGVTKLPCTLRAYRA